MTRLTLLTLSSRERLRSRLQPSVLVSPRRMTPAPTLSGSGMASERLMDTASKWTPPSMGFLLKVAMARSGPSRAKRRLPTWPEPPRIRILRASGAG